MLRFLLNSAITKIVAAILFTHLFSPSGLLANTPEALLTEGVNFYQGQKWKEAKEKFLELSLFPQWANAARFNLGNTAAKENHWGEALGYYKQALQLSPRDAKIRSHIQMALSKLPPSTHTEANNFLDLLKIKILTYCTLGEMIFTFFFISTIFIWQLLTVYNHKKNHDEQTSSGYSTRLIVLGLLTALLLLGTGLKTWDVYTPKAIVITSKAALKSGPDEKNTTLFELNEGVEVRIQETTTGWFQVSYGSDTMGWVPESVILVTSGGRTP